MFTRFSQSATEWCAETYNRIPSCSDIGHGITTGAGYVGDGITTGAGYAWYGVSSFASFAWSRAPIPSPSTVKSVGSHIYNDGLRQGMVSAFKEWYGKSSQDDIKTRLFYYKYTGDPATTVPLLGLLFYTELTHNLNVQKSPAATVAFIMAMLTYRGQTKFTSAQFPKLKYLLKEFADAELPYNEDIMLEQAAREVLEQDELVRHQTLLADERDNTYCGLPLVEGVGGFWCDFGTILVGLAQISSLDLMVVDMDKVTSDVGRALLGAYAAISLLAVNYIFFNTDDTFNGNMPKSRVGYFLKQLASIFVNINNMVFATILFGASEFVNSDGMLKALYGAFMLVASFRFLFRAFSKVQNFFGLLDKPELNQHWLVRLFCVAGGHVTTFFSVLNTAKFLDSLYTFLIFQPTAPVGYAIEAFVLASLLLSVRNDEGLYIFQIFSSLAPWSFKKQDGEQPEGEQGCISQLFSRLDWWCYKNLDKRLEGKRRAGDQENLVGVKDGDNDLIGPALDFLPQGSQTIVEKYLGQKPQGQNSSTMWQPQSGGSGSGVEGSSSEFDGWEVDDPNGVVTEVLDAQQNGSSGEEFGEGVQLVQ